MKVYLDTSALLKLYYPEQASEAVQKWVATQRAPIPYSPLHEIEAHNALAQKMFRKEIRRSQLEGFRKLLSRDLKEGVLQRVVVRWPEVYLLSLKLSAKWTPRLGTRSLDILHVAIARTTDQEGFFTFDERQGRLAQKAGLKLVRA